MSATPKKLKSVSLPESPGLFDLTDSNILDQIDLWIKNGYNASLPVVELGGATLITTAIEKGFSAKSIAAFMDAGLSPDASMMGIPTPFYAITSGNDDIAVEVVKRSSGFSINQLSIGKKANAYFISTLTNNLDLIESAYSAGGLPNYENEDGQNVLLFYLREANPVKLSTLKLLLNHVEKSYSHVVANPVEEMLRKTDSLGSGPISYLMLRMGQYLDDDDVGEAIISLSEFLIDKGASIESTDRRGYRPLHWAVKDNNRKGVYFLLSKGCDKTPVSVSGETPISLSTRHASPLVTEALLHAKSNPNSLTDKGMAKSGIFNAVAGNDIKTLSLLLQYGAEVNIISEGSDFPTPLLLAVHKGSAQIVKAIAERTSDLENPDCNNNTALLIALENFDKDPVEYNSIIETLQLNGASLLATNIRGENIIDIMERKNLLDIDNNLASLIYDRNIEYISDTYFFGDESEAKKTIASSSYSELYANLHSRAAERDVALVRYFSDTHDQNELDKLIQIKKGREFLMGSLFAAGGVTEAVNILTANPGFTTALGVAPVSISLAAGLGMASVAAWYMTLDGEVQESIKAFLKHDIAETKKDIRSVTASLCDISSRTVQSIARTCLDSLKSTLKGVKQLLSWTSNVGIKKDVTSMEVKPETNIHILTSHDNKSLMASNTNELTHLSRKEKLNIIEALRNSKNTEPDDLLQELDNLLSPAGNLKSGKYDERDIRWG
jgi:ankyrin repeat protein